MVTVMIVVVVVMGVSGVSHRDFPSTGPIRGLAVGIRETGQSAAATRTGRAVSSDANFFFASSTHCWNFALETASMAIGM